MGHSLSKLYRNEIDGLRAIAVMAVILNHLDHSLIQSGFLGVDIFFVISGFVITSSLARFSREATLFGGSIVASLKNVLKDCFPHSFFVSS